MCRWKKRRGETFYSRLFARFYDPFMAEFEQKILSHRRKTLLQTLRGNILEVGAGTGVNFGLYSADTTVLACEPSSAMLRRAAERLQRYAPPARITLVQAGIGDEELLEPHLPSEGLDAIVCTLVLCTVSDPEAALRRFKTWLKPGGKLIVLEHIQTSHPAKKWLHRLINPVWKQLAEGCHLTRPTDQLLFRQGFRAEEEEYFSVGLPFYQATMVIGDRPGSGENL